MNFRTLEPSEIECRVGQIYEWGLTLLLYKDARCDMNLLDEVVGVENWKREHSRDNRNCVVSIWSEKLNQWISKEDVGTVSNTEGEKGVASDSFKRACVNLGIGRELYSAPKITIRADKCEIKTNKKSGKLVCYDEFYVEAIKYDDKRNIVGLAIKNRSKGNSRVFVWTPEQTENGEFIFVEKGEK